MPNGSRHPNGSSCGIVRHVPKCDARPTPYRDQTATTTALADAKARGVHLGRPRLAQARKKAVETIEATADQHSANALPLIAAIKRAGATTLL